jgi:hypothetical protein
MATGWHALGHLGHCFLRDPNDLKAGASARDGLKALGHLGHFVTSQKLARDAACHTVHGFVDTNPTVYIYSIFYFNVIYKQ